VSQARRAQRSQDRGERRRHPRQRRPISRSARGGGRAALRSL